MSRPQNSVEPFPNPKNSQLGPKSQKWPQNGVKPNVRIERNKENKNCSTTWIDPKSVGEPFLNPKNSPKNKKMTPKFCQIQSQNWKKQIKSKLFNYMRGPQNSCRTLPQPKNSPLGPKKVKNDPKIKSKSKVRIEINIENESYSTTWVDPKTIVEPYHNPQK